MTVRLPLRIYRIEMDVGVLRNQLQEAGYTRVPVRESKFELYTSLQEREPPWMRFLQQITAEELSIKNRETSYILLYDAGDGMFATTGGQGHHAIEAAAEPDFGLEVLSRLATTPSVRLIRQLAPAGRILQQETISRSSFSFQADPGHVTRLAQHIIAQLSPTMIEQEFGIPDNGRQSVRLEGRAAFSIKRAISLDEFRKISNQLGAILKRTPTLPLMVSCQTVPRADWGELNETLRTKLEEAYEAGADHDEHRPPFLDRITLSHDDGRHLTQCSSFRVLHGARTGTIAELDISYIFALVRDWGRDRFPLAGEAHVEGLDDNGSVVFRKTLNALIVAELSLDGEIYFRVANRWFRARNEFVQELDARLRRFIYQPDGWNPNLPEWRLRIDHKKGRWTTISEDDYLLKDVCKAQPDVTVLHRQFVPITRGYDRAEICDLLDLTASPPTMFFVKRGLNEGARELARQAVDAIDLFLGERQFRERAREEIVAKTSNAGGSHFEPRQARIILAMTDKSLIRQDVPLLERLTSLSKMELVGALEMLDRYGINEIGLYEIPHAASAMQESRAQPA